MKAYLDLLQDIMENGTDKEDRTGTGTRSVFGRQLRFDLNEGFPLVTTKRIHLKSVIHELLWFLSGETNVAYLQENGVRIWNEWADEQGELGPVYGSQWRAWQAPDERIIDQMAALVEQINNNPDSRRHLISAWNVGELHQMKLPPCHYAFQFYVADGKLSCLLSMRSSDTFLGLPFNIAQYALLTHMIAQQCDLGVGEFIYSGGDVHIYRDHFEQVQLQLTREPYPLPELVLKRKPASLFDYNYDDFEFVNYEHHPTIKAQVSV
ncbi:thymidylate synthase [Paenibacillaceae bacterium]|nr:thymidylate synthase [Paenibacillaceae bacterium]